MQDTPQGRCCLRGIWPLTKLPRTAPKFRIWQNLARARQARATNEPHNASAPEDRIRTPRSSHLVLPPSLPPSLPSLPPSPPSPPSSPLPSSSPSLPSEERHSSVFSEFRRTRLVPPCPTLLCPRSSCTCFSLQPAAWCCLWCSVYGSISRLKKAGELCRAQCGMSHLRNLRLFEPPQRAKVKYEPLKSLTVGGVDVPWLLLVVGLGHFYPSAGRYG